MGGSEHGMALRRLVCDASKHMPAIVTLVTIVIGMFFIVVTPPGHIPDIWAHVYRIDGIPVSYTHLTLPTICSV